MVDANLGWHCRIWWVPTLVGTEQSSMARRYKRHQPKTNLPFIIAKWPGNEQKKV